MEGTMKMGRTRLVAVSLLAAMLGLGACSEGKPTTAAGMESKMRAEMLEAESQGAMGEVFAALRQSEPEIYEKMVAAMSKAAHEGTSPFEAGASVRPLYLARFEELAKTAADEDINELLAFTVRQSEAALAVHPQLCASLASGAADPRLQQLPKDIVEDEMRLMARMIRKGDQNSPGAPQETIDAWVGELFSTNPAVLEGLQLIGQPGLTDEQATAVCNSNLAFIKAVRQLPPTEAATMFRGLSQAS
jgi:hypothetical protein